MSKIAKPFIRAIVFSGLGLIATANASVPAWDITALSQPPAISATAPEVPAVEGLHAVYFDGLPWRGKPTRVFAYYGVPADASPEHKVPGIVLVHGAGGTAFSDWVKLWVSRGYAAIAFDDEGQLPVGKYNAWTRNPDGGPRRADIPQLDWPVTDQWMYHAIADTMLAHSLLASLPEVDADCIGTTGISWGGVVISNVAAIDTRLKFAVPVYGCGFISEESDDGSTFVGQKGTPEQRAAWRALWDPAVRLPQAKTPLLWVAGSNDFAFTMKAWQQSYRSAPGTQSICLRLRMPHGHGGAGENPEEIHAFADSIVGKGAPLAHVVKQGTENHSAWASYTSTTPLKRAELNFTRSSGRWQDRVWETAPATINDERVVAALPPGTTTYYFNLIDDRNLIVSTAHVELHP
ncbi:MAG: acetylxylan esterase [Opitutaceae bacterium]|jgi:dienelactone hydrolase